MVTASTKNTTHGPWRNARSVNLVRPYTRTWVCLAYFIDNTVTSCVYMCETMKTKCSSNSDCKGFNYDNDLGICRYKKSLSQYVHDRA